MTQATRDLEAALADPQMKRNDIAILYRDLLQQPGIDWRAINAAIIERWSKAGLIYIKERAWKLAS